MDLDDFAVFTDCLTSPDFEGVLDAQCQNQDADQDGDVDLVDFAEFQRLYSTEIDYSAPVFKELAWPRKYKPVFEFPHSTLYREIQLKNFRFSRSSRLSPTVFPT